METTKRPAAITIPGSIIVAAAIIAIAIIYVKKPAASNTAAVKDAPTEQSTIPDVTPSDHILGNPNAAIKVIEYSDPSCPFCKIFNPTMTRIMDEYGPSGKVAWVYRHFPLDKPDDNGHVLHPNAGHEAQALECAASLGGNDTFWTYEKKLYDMTPSVTADSPNGLDQKQLPQIAASVGLNAVSFNECLTSGQFKPKIDQEYLDGINAGITGTPYSVIVTPSGSKIPIVGAEAYATLKGSIDILLSQ
jgi:protein-disulfide isomerase